MEKYQANQVVPHTISTCKDDLIDRRGTFFVGGTYISDGDDYVMSGQMYVEVYIPKKISHRYPLVLVHGNGQTGITYLQTLDGRPGWLYDFLKSGYVVYIVDQPARGRSIYHRNLNGEKIAWPAKATAKLFSDPAGCQTQEKHTRWPGSGVVGDPIFDNFYRTQVDSLLDQYTVQNLMRNAGAALLEQIGPAILIGHSQGGPLLWPIANDHPELVKAIVSIEPSGPPFASAQTGEAILDKDGLPTTYGICAVPLDYEPPIDSPSQLQITLRSSEEEGKMSGFLQTEPARQLSKIKEVPVLVVTSETSYHAAFDYLTVEYLQQAGIHVTYLELGKVGIHGNGHMMMIEENSSEVASALDQWICMQDL